MKKGIESFKAAVQQVIGCFYLNIKLLKLK